MKKLSTADYASLMGINESTARKYARTGRVNAIKEKENNRDVYKILVDDNDPIFDTVQPAQHETHRPAQEEFIQEAEFVEDQVSYQLVSMEQSSFDNLINKFELIANDKAKTLETTLESVRAELFEVRAEAKKLSEQLQEKVEGLKDQLNVEKIKSAQFEAEVRIQQLKFKELEKELQEKVSLVGDKDSIIQDLRLALNQKDDQVKLLENQLKETEANFWTRARKL